MAIGVLTPDGNLNGESIFDAIRNRKPGEDPRKEYPNPHDGGGTSTDTEGDDCGEMGSGNSAPSGSRCNLPITCPIGSALEDDCSCSAGTLGMSFGDRNTCVNVVCPPDSAPTPTGGFDCMCSAQIEGDVPPFPTPPVSGSIGISAFETEAVVEHLVGIVTGQIEPGAEPGTF